MATYYISTSGDDDNPGTFAQPWATWQKGFDTAVAGDVVYIRGGVYYVTSSVGVSKNGGIGTSANPIRIYAYTGETPILDGSNINTNATHNGLYISNSSYYYLKGLTVRYFTEYGKYTGCPLAHGIALESCDHFTFERCVAQGNGRGFVLNGTTDYTHFLNCDAFDNEDFSDDGGYADGFGINLYDATHACHTSFEGCRSWHNSDDGWDFYSSDGDYRGGYVTINNCWSFRNGYRNGDGVGFKLGRTYSPKESGIQRTITNCLAFDNYLFGFDEGGDLGGLMDQVFYNNTAYNNAVGFYCNYEEGGGSVILKNNIAYANTNNTSFRDEIIHSYNSWNGSSISDADFVSLDDSGVDGDRESDGSLPLLNFLRLAESSDLIDAGTMIIGMEYIGAAPDLGAFEYGGENPPEPPEPPTTKYIANTGWHIPTWDEVSVLQEYLSGYLEAGGHLKEVGFEYWLDPNTGADNSSGFSARGSGLRDGANGMFVYLQHFFAIPYIYNEEVNTARAFGCEYNSAGLIGVGVVARSGMAIRFIKDDSNDTGHYTGNDGKVYPTVKIGDQVWMARSLAETRYRDGTVIPQVQPSEDWIALTTGAWCIYDNNGTNPGQIKYYMTGQINIQFSETGGLGFAVVITSISASALIQFSPIGTGRQTGVFAEVEYGYLYNAYVFKNHIMPPAGWSIPTKTQLLALANELGGEGSAGAKLKEIGFDHWLRPNRGATNESRFTALGADGRNIDGTFLELKRTIHIWSQTDGSPIFEGFNYTITCQNNASYGMLSVNRFKEGLPVRWIKDDSVNVGFVVGNDGKMYHTVKVGDQIWTATNVAETRYRNGEIIPQIIPNPDWAADEAGAWCIFGSPGSFLTQMQTLAQIQFNLEGVLNSQIEFYETKYGLLYNWMAAHDERSLTSSDDWRVAAGFIGYGDYRDYQDMIESIDPDATPWVNDAAPAFMHTSSDFWESGGVTRTNSTGFNAKGSGVRGGYWGTFSGARTDFQAWAASSFDDWGDNSKCIIALNYSTELAGYPKYGYGSPTSYKQSGFSVRLARLTTDLEEGETGSYTGNDGKIYHTICIHGVEYTSENLAETKYRNGDTIPEVTDDNAWKALTTGALCAYDNNWDNV